jgi:hypothetical protein
MLFIEYYIHIYDTFSYLKGCILRICILRICILRICILRICILRICILRICIIYFGLLSVKAPGFRQAF